jgi:inhibitor of KinA sporulation pathway (predicted exonuclease)
LWADLKSIFIGNFLGTYVRPRNSWDLKACKQKIGETLRKYIRRSKQCNELPDIVDADVIGAFISSTTNEALVHELGRNKPRTTRELLDLATSHAS